VGRGGCGIHRRLATGACLVLSALLGLSSTTFGGGVVAGSAAVSAGGPASPAGDAKLRNGLDRLVDDVDLLDPRIPGLVAGYRNREIPAFALLSAAANAQRRQAIVDRGGRLLRVYRSVRLVAIAARPAEIRSIAALGFVRWMAPVEVVVALADPEPMVDQSSPPTGTPIDLAVPQLWDQGITGKGITIAVLDTGMDLTHQDLDDLDFRHWGNPPNTPAVPGNEAKVVDARNFNGGGCAVPDGGGFDLHGHGTHVAGIAAGTGEGDPTTAADDGRVMGVAPDAKLAPAKVLTDAGAGVNSDLLAAMEWAAMPAGSGPATCPSVGAQVVNMSIGSESRPTRLNTDHDVDAVSYVLDHLAATYGTLFVAAQGNSGPYIGSALEAPGASSQAMSVGATAKDWDVNHDATASGDTCSGYQHTEPTCPVDAPGTQGRSLAPLSSRGPIEGRYMKPDLVAPGLNIVSTQGAQGALIAQNDLNAGTRDDPFYATASGTSMASPAAAGVAALLWQAYHDKYGTFPVGPSGRAGVKARSYVLLRAALMNTAASGLAEARWMLTTDDGTLADAATCPAPGDPISPILCDFAGIITGGLLGSLVLQGPRNGAADPKVGPFGEGAGKIRAARAMKALRDGLVVYGAVNTASPAGHPAHQDFQGAWQVGELIGGAPKGDRFVLHAAPGARALSATFSFAQGSPSDQSLAIPTSGPMAWSIGLPGVTAVPAGGDRIVRFTIKAPVGTPPGYYSGVVNVAVSNGQQLHLPVIASVPLHDPKPASGNVPGPTAAYNSAMDVYAKGDTTWPSVAGQANGAVADWLGLNVRLGAALESATFRIWDSAAGDETYDLYLYRDNRLIASTHPFTAPDSGITDTLANNARGPSTAAAPQVLTLASPLPGRYTLVVNRARVGTVDAINGDFGSFSLTLDEVGP
jgi:subtilisin family serine protease